MMTADPEVLDGWVADGAHHYLLRVQFEDTDAGGIVYHANYLAFAERARSAYLRCIDIRQEEQMSAGAVGAIGADRPAALYAGWCHHKGRPSDNAATRPVRHSDAAAILRP